MPPLRNWEGSQVGCFQKAKRDLQADSAWLPWASVSAGARHPPVRLQDVDDPNVQEQTLPSAIHGRDPTHPGERRAQSTITHTIRQGLGNGPTCWGPNPGLGLGGRHGWRERGAGRTEGAWGSRICMPPVGGSLAGPSEWVPAQGTPTLA